MSLWKRLIKEQLAKKSNQGTPIYSSDKTNAGFNLRTYRLVYKVKYFLDEDLEDNAAIELWYIQAKRDLQDLRYLVTLQDCKVLVALQLQEENGDCPENGICQKPTTDYTISGTTLTFTTAPANGVAIQIRELP